MHEGLMVPKQNQQERLSETDGHTAGMLVYISLMSFIFSGIQIIVQSYGDDDNHYMSVAGYILSIIGPVFLLERIGITQILEYLLYSQVDLGLNFMCSPRSGYRVGASLYLCLVIDKGLKGYKEKLFLTFFLMSP